SAVISTNCLVFVRQFRPGLYLARNPEFKDFLLKKQTENDEMQLDCPPTKNGILIELCAGMIDPGETPLTAAARELFEETGYSISTDKFEFVNTNVSITGVQRLNLRFLTLSSYIFYGSFR
ncbi:hypothetical protein HZS_6166, partial [Henneguya salminicola]